MEDDFFVLFCIVNIIDFKSKPQAANEYDSVSTRKTNS